MVNVIISSETKQNGKIQFETQKIKMWKLFMARKN